MRNPAIDPQFTLDSIADLDAVRARRIAAARDADGRYMIKRAIAYGGGAGETLDLYPAAQANAPALLFIHGGFWRSMSAADFSFLANGFHAFGVALAVIDYPLMPEARLADIVDSCRRAIAWLYRHGGAHGIDADRIFVAGNSAGGHLVAEMVDRAWMRAANLPENLLKGGCAISGLFELQPVADSFQNDFLRLTDEEIARFSPLKRAVDVGAPLIVTVGGNETEEFLRQSAAYAQACRAAGVSVEHTVDEGTDHITVVLDSFANPDAALNRAMRRMIGVL